MMKSDILCPSCKRSFKDTDKVCLDNYYSIWHEHCCLFPESFKKDKGNYIDLIIRHTVFQEFIPYH